MSIASQLYQLQELDTELESDEQTVNRITRELADTKAISEARYKLDSGRLRVQELVKQQRSLENEIADLTAKITTIEKELYGGKVRNPKELTDLQREADALKPKRAQLEEKGLDMMEQVEAANLVVTGLAAELNTLQAEKQSQQKLLSEEQEKTRAALAGLKEKRQETVSGIDPHAVAVYEEIRKQRGTAVARVEQGLCKGCRISLPLTELQKAKKGELVRCGSCGRILYQP